MPKNTARANLIVPNIDGAGHTVGFIARQNSVDYGDYANRYGVSASAMNADDGRGVDTKPVQRRSGSPCGFPRGDTDVSNGVERVVGRVAII
jgi:hypothetical protein